MGCTSSDVKTGDRKDEITLEFTLEEEDNEEIYLFGSEFSDDNRDKLKMVIEGKEYELKEKFNLSNLNNKTNILKVTFKGVHNIEICTYMFASRNIISISDLSPMNKCKIAHMDFMFKIVNCNNYHIFQNLIQKMLKV